ncbi:MAG: hypothetical protein ACTHLW_12190 [Verrucomicrobiota bacterium]
MQKFNFIRIGLLLCVLLTGVVRAETFTLEDGKTLIGELIPGSADDSGVQIKVDANKYERVPWTSFSQAKLKEFAKDQKNKKLAQFAEPFIEITDEHRIKKTEVTIQPVPRLERPSPQSLAGAMFSSSVGLFLIFAMYGANIYAGYEVAVFRAQSKGLVCGLAAVLPIIAPIVFLSMPTRMTKNDEQEAAEAEAAALPAPTFTVANAEAEAAAAAAPGGLHLAHADGEQGNPALPQTQIFQRGAFTFNRRFIETKFSGFFGVVRRDSEKEMVLLVKAARGTYTGIRVSRITANDMHLQIQKGNASEEVMIPFSEITEIQLKHKDA